MTQPTPDTASAAQAAAWGVCTLGLSVAFLWGYHHAGIRFPTSRTALAVLLPLSLLGRLPTAARNVTAPTARAQNILNALPSDAVLWDPASSGALLYARFVDGRRPDVRIARRPSDDWARAEYRRNHPAPEHPSPYLLSRDLFFLDIARDDGAGPVFTDDPARLPAADPATGQAVAGRFPDDALPVGVTLHFLPADTHRLIAPAAQLSQARIPLWAARTDDPSSMARARMALSRKFDQYNLSADAEEEAWAALASDPGAADAHLRLAVAALSRGDAARARIHIDATLRRDPRHADAWDMRAQTSAALGDRRGLIAAADKALRLDPTRNTLRRQLAEALDADHAYRAAAEQWRILMDRDPADVSSIWNLAKDEAAVGRIDKARAALKEYLILPLSPERRAEAEAFDKSLADKR
jgi:hypothetical protein